MSEDRHPDTIVYTDPHTGRVITLTGFTSYAEGAKAAAILAGHLKTQARLIELETSHAP